MTLWTPENTFRIRGSGRRWFERIVSETFGEESQNIIEPPPSGRQPPLLLHSSLQPVYIVNGAEFQSNPTQLEANVQAEISAGRGTLQAEPLYVEEVTGGGGGLPTNRQFVNYAISSTFANFAGGVGAVYQTVELTEPTGMQPWGTVVDVSLTLYNDVGHEMPTIANTDAVTPIIVAQLETQYAGNQYAEQTIGTWMPGTGSGGGSNAYRTPFLIYDALPLGHPWALAKLDPAYNGPTVRIGISRLGTGTTATWYVGLNLIIEIWPTTGGNAADYPYAANPMTFITAATEP